MTKSLRIRALEVGDPHLHQVMKVYRSFHHPTNEVRLHAVRTSVACAHTERKKTGGQL